VLAVADTILRTFKAARAEQIMPAARKSGSVRWQARPSACYAGRQSSIGSS
jgi:hypothetical protein